MAAIRKRQPKFLNDVQLGKKLTWLLRHGAAKEGLPLSPDGFVPVNSILQHPHYASYFTFEMLQKLVHADRKQRYTLRCNAATGAYEIRANQGHSIEHINADKCMTRIDNPNKIPMAVHGTYYRHWDGIKETGLNRMNRNHIHMATSDDHGQDHSTASLATDSNDRAEINNYIMASNSNRMHKTNNNHEDLNEEINATTMSNLNECATQNSNGNPSAIVEQEEKEKEDNDISEGHMCMICFMNFNSFYEVLRHELTVHNISSRNMRPIRNIVNILARMYNSPEQSKQRRAVKAALMNCSSWDTLKALLSCYMKNEYDMQRSANDVISAINDLLRPFGRFTTYIFGSYANSLCLTDSDIDLYVKENSIDFNMATYHRICRAMMSSKLWTNVVYIRSARVPIIRALYIPLQLNVDINLTNNNCLHNSNFIKDVMAIDERIRLTALFLKIWAKQHLIIGRGHMSSYCFITLIIFYLQSNIGEYGPILPPIETLQQNVAPIVHSNINYAYSFSGHINRLPSYVTPMSLIKGFFSFYKNFDFNNTIIAPYLGMAIHVDTFKDPKFQYPQYQYQMTTAYNGYDRNIAPSKLEVDHCMVVQDIFCLTYNLARSVTAHVLEFFQSCLNHYAQVCLMDDEKGNSNDGKLYRTLLFNIASRVICNRPSTENVALKNHPCELTLSFQRPNTENRTIIAWIGGTPSDNKIHQIWSMCYVKAFEQLLQQIFLLNLIPLEKNNFDPQKSYNEFIWHVTGNLDLWTGRQMSKDRDIKFMEHHRLQTQLLLADRVNDTKFKINFKTKFTFKIYEEINTIHIFMISQPPMVLNRKHYLNRLFTTIKTSLQQINIKEILETNTLNYLK